MNSVTRVPTLATPGELDVLQLILGVWRRRAFVFAIACVFAILGAGYSLTVTPIYEASTSLRPVALDQLDALNRSQIYSLPPDAALKRVGAALASYNVRLDFFRSRPDLINVFQSESESLEQAFENFNRNTLSLLQPDSKSTVELLSNYVGLKIIYEDEINGAAVLNDFVDYAVERERLQLANELKVIKLNRLSEINSKLDAAFSEYQTGKESRMARLEENDAIKRAELNDELRALRVQLKLRREARLAQLAEAIDIAKSLGLRKPSTPSLMADGAGGGNVIRTEVNNQQAPLYFLGTEVLEAERNTLRKRTSDDFAEPRIAQIRKELILLSTNRKIQALKERASDSAFLEGIESLRVERGRLQNIDTDLNGLQLVSVDQRAVPSTRPIKPQKIQIVLIAFVFGLVVGVIAAFLRTAFREYFRNVCPLEIDGAVQRVPAEDLQIESGRLAEVR